MIDALGAAFSAGFPDAREAARFGLRLFVALGTTLFVVAGIDAGMSASSDAMSRLIQGIATGIGFLGAGTILKLQADREILGLTTAAGIWMTAAASVAVGLGRYGMALASAVVAWFVLAALSRLERRMTKRRASGARQAARATVCAAPAAGEDP